MEIIGWIFLAAFALLLGWQLVDRVAFRPRIEVLRITHGTTCAGDDGCAASISYRVYNGTRLEVFDLEPGEQPSSLPDSGNRVFRSSLAEPTTQSGPLDSEIEHVDEDGPPFQRIIHHPAHAPGVRRFFIRVTHTNLYGATFAEEDITHQVLAVDETASRAFTESFWEQPVPADGRIVLQADRILATPDTTGTAWLTLCGSLKLVAIRVGKRELALTPTRSNPNPPDIQVPDVQVTVLRGSSVIEDLGTFPDDTTRSLQTPVEISGDEPLIVRTSMTRQIEPVDYVVQGRWDGAVTLLCQQKLM